MMRNLNRFSSISNYLTKNVFNKAKSYRFSNSLTSESFASGTSAIYIEHLYSQWLADPSSVDISWQNYFTNVERNLGPGIAFQSPPTIDPSKIHSLY